MSDTLLLCCRVCLDLTGEQICALSDSTLRHQLETCLSITVSDADELPTNVCVKCAERLGEFYSFRTSADSSQEWLEATVRTSKRNKHLQPLPDTEYNSDSLLEFLNNTENIEEYLDGLGDADETLPSLAGLLDRQPDASLEFAGKLIAGGVKVTKITSTKAEEAQRGRDDTYEIHMEIDVLDSEGEGAEHSEDAENSAPSCEVNAYSCLACKATYSELGELSAHMSVCEIASRTCFECGKHFDSRRQMVKHRVTHAQGEGAQSCAACGKKFANRARQLQHYEKCHNDFVANMGCVYRCKECGDLFRDRLLLYRHAWDHIENRQKSKADKSKTEDASTALYRCKVCRVVCADRKQLYAHVKQHTAELSQRHLCHACGKSYTSLAALKRHVVATHGESAAMQAYKCQRCGTQCVDEETLQRHSRLHEREAAICEFCGLTFFKLQFLQKHVKEQHSCQAVEAFK